MSEIQSSSVQPQATLVDGQKTACPSLAMASPTPTITADLEASPNHSSTPLPSNFRRYFLLSLFAMAQFIDVYLSTAVLIGITAISRDLGMTTAESVWMLNAYAATLAAFLLTAGRIADIWKPKWVFILGFTWVGATSLGSGFITDKVTLFALRALTGIGAAFTIPSAIALIVRLFPEEREQSRAIAVFGGSGAIANVLGFLLGGVLLIARWEAIFWFTGALALPLSLAAVWLIPATPVIVEIEEAGKEGVPSRLPKLDYFGAFFQTGGIVLLVFGLTQANVIGWAQAETLAPVLIGIALFVVFFWYQTRLHPIDALVMPKTWSIMNFTLLTIVALCPSFWWYHIQISWSAIMQDDFGWSPIITAVHFIPVGIAGGSTVFTCGALPLKYFPLRYRILLGCLMSAGGSLLLSFAKDRSDYWPLMLPGFLIGSSGSAFIYVSANIALVLSVPPEHAGVAGGVFNTALQVGATVLLALATTIQVAFPVSPGSTVPSHHGYSSSFLFAMAVMLFEGVLILIFFKDPLAAKVEDSAEEDFNKGRIEDEKRSSLSLSNLDGSNA